MQTYDESKKMMSDKKKAQYMGEGNPFYGKRHSKETKEILRNKNIGKKYSPETNKKKAHWGKDNPSSHKCIAIFDNGIIKEYDMIKSLVNDLNCNNASAYARGKLGSPTHYWENGKCFIYYKEEYLKTIQTLNSYKLKSIQGGSMKPLFLFVGKSASGKTTIANILEADGYKQVQSYTTRPKRYKEETGHTFISEDEFDKLQNIMAYTKYNDYRYCTTLEQINNADIYVIDPFGVKTLLDNYSSINRDICIIYFDANVYSRIQRMLARDDSDTQIVGRLLTDEETNWLKDLIEINTSHNNKAKIYTVDANANLQTVCTTVKNLIQMKENNSDG